VPASSFLPCDLKSRPCLKSFIPVTFAASLLLAAGGCSSGTAGSTGTTSTSPGTSVASVAITGSGQVRVGGTSQFIATVAGSTSNEVAWQVNGVAGGASATGVISTTGLYTAPATLPSPNTVTILAVSAAASATGTMAETILNPVPNVTAATATQSGTATIYTVTVTGSGFINGAQIEVAGNAVTTTFVSATQLTAAVTVASGTTSLAIDVVNPASGDTPSATVNAAIGSGGTTAPVTATVTAAARLLDQATFGPTLTDIQHVQQTGVDGYITEQFNTAPTPLPDIPAAPTAICDANGLLPCEQSEWWQTMLTAPDQLRQRVAFALSEIFVVSTDDSSLSVRVFTPYQNILAKDAFTNFSTIMKDVTLSPAMGGYLNMVNSGKPPAGQIANENYAREFMQLFTTGLYLLNSDGTSQLDSSGNPIPVYTEDQVQAFARVYTGWTYPTSTGAPPAYLPYYNVVPDSPMVAVESAHDTTSKTLLNGTVLPAGQTAEQDLADALANVFAHPNVGPFVCRQLIQHLVASNPSPAYVGRVSAIFANNGSGVRGDMQAVIRAILEDPDARAGDTNPSFDGGHLREDMLYMTDVLRGLGFTATSADGNYSGLNNYTSALGETPYTSTSVFNFFPPDYFIPGTTTNAPEFGQENTASTILRLTLADNLVNNKISNFNIDLSATSALGITASKTGVAATDAGNLVDSLGIIFMHGQMPAQMRTAIVNHVATLTNIPERVRVATYLVITSSQYKIEN
jgi:uncharacterized protein (DUF1800 family)